MTYRCKRARLRGRLHPVWLLAAVTGLIGAASMATADNPPYKDRQLPVEARVADLIGRMTLDEKLAQLRCDGSGDVWGPALETTAAFAGPPLYFPSNDIARLL